MFVDLLDFLNTLIWLENKTPPAISSCLEKVTSHGNLFTGGG